MNLIPARCGQRWLAALALIAIVALTACTPTPAAVTANAAAALPSPVPPAALATLPPPKPPRPAAASDGPSINIENFNFIPADLSVAAGTTVVWTNHDDVEHTVTVSDNSFSSPSIQTDAQFSHTFTQPGTYSYFCAIHPFMTAKVLVQ